MLTRLQQLYTEHGQSPWLDAFSRSLIHSGALMTLIDQGIRGVTANPSIFAQAISEGSVYEPVIAALLREGVPSAALAERIMVDDLRLAADSFQPLYERSGGRDGWVSIEVSPQLANDTQGTVAAARRLIRAIDRPNVFVKVPATPAGLLAIHQLLVEGINVNITLIFSLDTYRNVIEAHVGALEERLSRGLPVDRPHSVASFFLSRIDTRVDARLDELSDVERDPYRRRALEELHGAAAIANARQAYQLFMATVDSGRFQRLKRAGAQEQRLLWASTGTKNPRYSDLRYVENLIGPDTITTLPLATVAALLDHAHLARTLDQHPVETAATLERLEALEIDLEAIGEALLADGVEQFVSAEDRLKAVLRERVAALEMAPTPVASASDADARRSP